MTNQLYMISLRWIDTPINPEMIEHIISRYGDWLRWNGWTWLLASRSATAEIRQALTARLQPNDSLIIAPTFAPGMDGWAPEWVWTWARQRGDPNYVPSALPPPPPPPPPPNPAPFGGLAGLYDPLNRNR